VSLLVGEMKVCKKFEWEMGHRLLNHPGKCSRPHGHSYSAEVVFLASTSENGFAVELGAATVKLAPIFEQLDHAFMVREDDELFSYRQGKPESRGILRVPFEPTTENLAKMLFFKITSLELPVESVRVWETRKIWAEFTKSDSSFAEQRGELATCL